MLATIWEFPKMMIFFVRVKFWIRLRPSKCHEIFENLQKHWFVPRSPELLLGIASNIAYNVSDKIPKRSELSNALTLMVIRHIVTKILEFIDHVEENVWDTLLNLISLIDNRNYEWREAKHTHTSVIFKHVSHDVRE